MCIGPNITIATKPTLVTNRSLLYNYSSLFGVTAYNETRLSKCYTRESEYTSFKYENKSIINLFNQHKNTSTPGHTDKIYCNVIWPVPWSHKFRRMPMHRWNTKWQKKNEETKIIRQGSAAKGQCECPGFYWSPSFSRGSLSRGAGKGKERRRIGKGEKEEKRASGVPQTRARSNIYPVILVRVLRAARGYMCIHVYIHTWDRTISTSEEHESRGRDAIDPLAREATGKFTTQKSGCSSN